MKRLTNLVLAVVLAVGFAQSAWATAAAPANAQNGPNEVTNQLQSTQINGGQTLNGSLYQNPLGTPSAPTITQVGTAGSTSYTYYCVAQDVNAASAGGAGETVPSASATTTTGNATLSSTNYNVVQCGGTVGAVSYRVLKANNSHSLGVCQASSSGGYCSVIDKTTGAGTAYTANSADQTGNLTTGGPATVSGNLTVNGTVTTSGGTLPNQQTIVRQTTVCSTSGASNAVCGEPTITGLPFADTNYSVACSCVGLPTTGSGVGPWVQYVIKAAATGGVASNAQVFIGGTAQGTNSCVEVDCNFWHN
jgi:hypothetical protein